MIINPFHSFENITPIATDPDSRDYLIIDFTPLSWNTWRDICARATRFPLTQSYEYACAMAATSSLRPRWGVIRASTTQNILGVVQIFEVGIPKLWVQSIMIDRGPVWFHGADTTDNVRLFWKKINQEYPARLWRQRRFIPEQTFDESGQIALISSGLRPRNTLQPYQTIWLDLTLSLDQIKKNIRKTWYHSLEKAHNYKILSIKYLQTPLAARHILKRSIDDARKRGYPVPPKKLIEKMIEIFSKNNRLHVFLALDGTQDVSGIIVFEHEKSATWQVGFVSNRGRELHANHLLVMEMIQVLKKHGIASLDLGGVNDDNAKGVSLFKSGLRGDHVILVGAFQ